MFAFDHPWAFVLLPLPWLLRAALPPRRGGPPAVRVPFGDRLDDALRGDLPVAATQAWQAAVFPTAVWLLVLTATARPQWVEPPMSEIVPTRDLLLLVDLSASMQQEDFQNEAGERVDRLSAVKEVLEDFLTRREGDRVGLIVFGDAAYLQAPFSTDLDLARQLLEECQVGMAGPRTALGDAIGLGVGLFGEDDDRAKTIIALTDGNDTKSRVPPVEAARVAAQRDVTVHTVAIGDPTTVGEDQLDEQALRDVAAETGGSYYFAADRTALEGIYTELDRIETREVETVSHRPRRDLFHWPLAAALLASMAGRAATALRRGGTAVLPAAGAAGGGEVRVDPFTGRLEATT